MTGKPKRLYAILLFFLYFSFIIGVEPHQLLCLHARVWGGFMMSASRQVSSTVSTDMGIFFPRGGANQWPVTTYQRYKRQVNVTWGWTYVMDGQNGVLIWAKGMLSACVWCGSLVGNGMMDFCQQVGCYRFSPHPLSLSLGMSLLNSKATESNGFDQLLENSVLVVSISEQWLWKAFVTLFGLFTYTFKLFN